MEKDNLFAVLGGDAKKKLVKWGARVPPADPVAVARMQKEQSVDRPGLVKRSVGVLKTCPDVSTAAHNGPPTMTPASESGDETIGFRLQPNANPASPPPTSLTSTHETPTPP